MAPAPESASIERQVQILMNLYLKYKNPAILLQIEELEKGGPAAHDAKIPAASI